MVPNNKPIPAPNVIEKPWEIDSKKIPKIIPMVPPKIIPNGIKLLIKSLFFTPIVSPLFL